MGAADVAAAAAAAEAEAEIIAAARAAAEAEAARDVARMEEAAVVAPVPSVEDDAVSVAGTEASDLDQLEASSSCDDFVMIQDGVAVSQALSSELVSLPASPAPAVRSGSDVSAASAIAMVEAVAVADAADAATAAASA